jgi:hypothetical protein
MVLVEAELDRWLDERQATPPAHTTEQVLAAARRLGTPDPARPHAASLALGELRDDRA